jgi:hypothetical protein
MKMLEDKYVNGRGLGRAELLLRWGKPLIERLQIHRPSAGRHLHHGDRSVPTLSFSWKKD